MSDVFEIAEILVSHAVRAHKDEIAIIAYYGSYAKGLASPTSDLDIFYIPDEGKAGALCSQFIIHDLPYDFWPVSWAFAENIAHAGGARPWAVSASLIADAQVLYHRSAQDLERFNALQARIAELTRPESRELMVGKALDAFKQTLFQLGQIRLAVADDDLAGMRWAGQKLVNSAANCLALVNQTYFSKGWGANLTQVLELSQEPDGLADLVKAVILPQDTDSMLEAADELAKKVRGILRQAQASISTCSVNTSARTKRRVFRICSRPRHGAISKSWPYRCSGCTNRRGNGLTTAPLRSTFSVTRTNCAGFWTTETPCDCKAQP